MKRLLLILILLASPVWAVQPDEVLDDPVLEDRARDISAGLRCPVCQNESIDESSAEISRDLRLLVRERLIAGDSDREVVDYVVARYGEFVLLQPNFNGANRVLWVLPLVLLAVGLGLSAAYIRGRSRAPAPTEAGLDAQEQARLDEILGTGAKD
ncbi:cytochrome c-type biogenesis protein [Gymnodinialimonas sp. 2305UL16-5]|uniref:cytochrome c-type biogenesis protein n=1 Tax=Gymnodinialimonas mytili TaxID=3126503 RepID=UPI0030A96047